MSAQTPVLHEGTGQTFRRTSGFGAVASELPTPATPGKPLSDVLILASRPSVYICGCRRDAHRPRYTLSLHTHRTQKAGDILDKLYLT